MTKIKTITIATPMYGGQCHGSYLVSVMHFKDECAKLGINVNFSYTTNESLIQRARNTLATNFLETDSDILLFIDGDIRFDGKAMLDMVLEGKDVIGAITPLKKFNYSVIIDGVLAMRSLEKAHLLGGYYNFNNNITEEIKSSLLEKKSIKVNRIGTGVLSISRKALTEMASFVSIYRDDNPIGKQKTMYDFFPVTIEYDDEWGASRMMSEDYNFCNNWVKIGGEIWAKDGIVKSHAGSFEFCQNLTEDIKAKNIIDKAKESQ